MSDGIRSQQSQRWSSIGGYSAYSDPSWPTTDYRISEYPISPISLTRAQSHPRAWDLLEGVDTIVLSALRPEPHPTHFSFSEAIEASRLIGARKTYFIHMTHTVMHERDSANLPEGVELGYDGLIIEVSKAHGDSGSSPE